MSALSWQREFSASSGHPQRPDVQSRRRAWPGPDDHGTGAGHRKPSGMSVWFTETKIGPITERASDQTVCPSAGHELELTLLRNRLHRRADRDGVRWNIGRAVGVRKAEGLLQCWLRLALDRRDGLLAHRARGLDSRSHLSRIRGAALSPLAYPS